MIEKNFMIRCARCNWRTFSTGITADLKADGLLVEQKKNCATCGGARVFKCPKCGQPAKMFRMKKV